MLALRRSRAGHPGTTACLAILAAAVVAGCGDDGGGGGGGGAYGGQSAAASSGHAAKVAVRSTGLGDVLVGGSGRTLYLFEKDTGPRSTCFGACASAWPPYATNGKPVAGSGAQASMLGTTSRKDGKTQVTYNGHPLYYYAGDGRPGQTNGQDLDQFGAEWYAVSPGGDKVEDSGGGEDSSGNDDSGGGKGSGGGKDSSGNDDSGGGKDSGSGGAKPYSNPNY